MSAPRPKAMAPMSRRKLMLVEGASVAPSVPVQTIGAATRPAAADAARNQTNIFGGCLLCNS